MICISLKSTKVRPPYCPRPKAYGNQVYPSVFAKAEGLWQPSLPQCLCEGRRPVAIHGFWIASLRSQRRIKCSKKRKVLRLSWGVLQSTQSTPVSLRRPKACGNPVYPRVFAKAKGLRQSMVFGLRRCARKDGIKCSQRLG